MKDPLPTLDADQTKFLRSVYDEFHEKSAWPVAKDLHRSLIQDGLLRVYEAGERVPDDYLLRHADARGGIALRLPGFLAGVGQCEELSDFIAVLRLASRHYRSKGVEPRIYDTDLGQLDIRDGRLKRFQLLLEPREFLVGPNGTADLAQRLAFHYEISESIDAYLDVETTEEFIARYRARRAARTAPYAPQAAAREVDRRRVFVIHGRNGKARDAVVALLRTFDLEPVLFGDILPKTGIATPYVGDVLGKGFDSTFASVVVMTPDDAAWLLPRFYRSTDPDYEKRPSGQARPNVLFEAGMGWSSHRGRVVLLHLGQLRPLTDLEGLHVIHFTDSSASRLDLGARLQSVGCPVNLTTQDWLTAGDFASAIEEATGAAVAAGLPELEIVFDPGDKSHAVEHWAEQPHRLAARTYRVGIRNNTSRSIEGVRLLLADVPEQPYRQVYLRLAGDRPPYPRSNEGVRLDPGGIVLADVVAFNHENKNEEVQFAYATVGEPNLRPPGSYTLSLVAEGKDVEPARTRFRVSVEPGYGLRFGTVEQVPVTLRPSSGASLELRLEVANEGPAMRLAARCRIVARRNDRGGQPLRTGSYQLAWVEAPDCEIALPASTSRTLLIATWKAWREQQLAQIDLPECTSEGRKVFETSRWNQFENEPLPEHDIEVELASGERVIRRERFTARPSSINGPLELFPLGTT